MIAIYNLVSFDKLAAHNKTFNKTYPTSEDSNQPAHPRSLTLLTVLPSIASRLSNEGQDKIFRRKRLSTAQILFMHRDMGQL